MESMIHTKLHQSDKAKNVNVKNKKSKRSPDSHSKSFFFTSLRTLKIEQGQRQERVRCNEGYQHAKLHRDFFNGIREDTTTKVVC